MTAPSADATPPDPPLCVVTDAGCDIPEAERDRNLFTAGEWPHETVATLDGAWTCRSGHLFRHLHVYNEEEKPEEADPSKLWEALLRFPNAPVYGTHKKRKPPFVFTDEGSWPNFHTMRVLGPGVAPARRVKHIYLLHNGLNETTDLRFHYRLAAWILANRRDAVCILRPLPGHLSRFAFHGPYAEQPLDVYLRDPADLFRQFLRHMLETQWLLSALVPRSSYAVMGGTRLLAEAEPDGSTSRGRSDVAELARVMESEWEAAFKSAEQADRVNPTYHKRRLTRDELEGAVSELRTLLGWRPQRSTAPPAGDGEDGVPAGAEPPAIHVVGYSMGGFMAQAAFFAWPFAISSCTNMFAGGALRDLAPTAFAHHEEWQAVLHGMRYELDVAFRRNFRLDDEEDRDGAAAVRAPDPQADTHGEQQSDTEQPGPEPEDRTAGVREEDFAYFTRVFYEVYLQYYRGGYQSRVAEFSRRLLFVVGGDDPIVRTKNVLEAAPKGMTLLQLADVSHFPASRGRGPDGGKAETEQRKYWLPEIGRVIANFSERAEGLLAHTLATSWNAAAGNGSTPRSAASRLQPLEQAPEFLDSIAFARELRRLVQLIEPARKPPKGEPTGPGWLLIGRNEVPPVFMGSTGFRFHGQAVHHAEQQIAEYVHTLRDRARHIFRRRDRTTLLIPSAGDRWFWNTKFVSMSETPSAARVPDADDKRRMIAAFQRWVRAGGVVREAVADEYAIPSDRLGRLGDAVAAKIEARRVSLTILPDVWIAVSARVLKRLRGDVAEDDREENEQAIVKWARRLVPQEGDPLTELQEDLDSGNVLAITVSAAELNPRYRGRRLLSAKNVAAAIVHWALAYEASDAAKRAPPMKTEKPPRSQPAAEAAAATNGAQADGSANGATELVLTTP